MRWARLAGWLMPFLILANSPFCWPDYVSTHLLPWNCKDSYNLKPRIISRNLNGNDPLSWVFLFQVVVSQADELWLILTLWRDLQSQIRFFFFHPESDWETLWVSVWMCECGKREETFFFGFIFKNDIESWLNDPRD